MSKARVAVLKVITKELTVTAAAEKYGFSRRHLHRLLARYRQGGLDAVDPRSRRPHAPGNATSQETRQLVVHLRLQLIKDGLDATATVIALETGEILSVHTIDPDQHYWRNTQRAPGRWPGAL